MGMGVEIDITAHITSRRRFMKAVGLGLLAGIAPMERRARFGRWPGRHQPLC